MSISYNEDNRPTLQSVANMAGVSVSTVSLVLSGKGGDRRISKSTSERINRAAEQVGYAPNILTRSLRNGRTRIISFFSAFRHREWGDLYMDRMSAAVETTCGDLGYDVLIQCNFDRSLKQTFEFLNGGIAEGVLMFAPAADDPLVALLRKSKTPVVILNGHDPLGQYSSVSDDVYSGMQLIAEQVVAEGHRHLLAITSDHSDSREAELRVKLLKSYLEVKGVTTTELCWNGNSDELSTFLTNAQDSGTLPSAVFCWHDRRAYAFVEQCELLGISIPGTVSVFGYDAIHWPSTSPHIVSSIDVSVRRIAQVGAQILDKVIVEPRFPVRHELVPVDYRAGTTTRFTSLAKVQS